MIRNYFKIAWRTLLKNKAMFSINIIGLAIGIATCLIITLFVVDELSYDRYNEKSDQIVRVILKAKLGEEIINESDIPAPIAKTFISEFPEVLNATRAFTNIGTPKVTYKENTLRKGKFAFVDANFFGIFTLPIIKGDAKTALNKPNSVVLTKAQAELYFGDEEPMGKMIQISDIGFYENGGYVNNNGLYTVTGIIEKVPDNSHFHFDIFASMASNKEADNQSWMTGDYQTYLLMRKGTDLTQLEQKIPPIVKKYMGSQIEGSLGMTFEEFLKTGNEVGLFTEKLTDIHFSKSGSTNNTGDIQTVYMFALIALFMLLIACINFMNLSTASASKRVKEIGMRKVLGSTKKQLINQFLTESFISTLIAMCIGVIIFVLALPYFNQLSGKSLDFNQIFDPKIIIALIGLTLVISFLAGGYPAFFMSSFKPIQALKNKFTSGSSKGIRSGLVVFQFTVSVGLIIGTLVVSQQMNYIQNKDVGYEKEQLIVMRNAGRLGNDFNAFKEEIQNETQIQSITMSSYVPAGSSDGSTSAITTKHQIPQTLRSRLYFIDEEYIPTLGMEILLGRNFSKEFGREDKNIIINETAIKTFGFNENPIGETISMATDNNGAKELLTVVGVVKDFHLKSLHNEIEPLLMQYNPYYGLIIKAKTSDMASLIATMKSKWEAFGSGETFEYAFLDELYNETYLKETNMNTILKIFALLTIFVACLGLFGLVTFTAEQRFKEIGIRKVLGSSIPQIVGMLSKDFIKLVFVSFIIAFPLGYYLMNKWLQDFAYRIDIHWSVFVFSGLITIGIAFITISFRSIKAASVNPIKSLKTE